MSEAPNAAQVEYWNDTMGPVWVEMQAGLDRQIAPLGHAAMRALAARPGEHILDIGCGCGQSTWELAAQVGPSGAVTGIDLSGPMLAVASAHKDEPGAPRPAFRQADAQTESLGEFDAAFSRFGVMFFSDPAAAFANIRKALKPGGRLAFVCWRAVSENPIMSAPAEAAAPFLPPMTSSDPNAPGPFAFADPARVRAILAAAAFSQIVIEPFDAVVGGADLDGALTLAMRIGPLGAALRADPNLGPRVIPAVRERLATYLTAAGVMIPAAVWIVTARVQ